MEKKVFISYAREDHREARRLFSELNKLPHITPWLDSECLLPGARWEKEILEQIESSDFIILLLSEKSISKSGYVQREINEAINRLLCTSPHGRVVIPVRLDNCSIPYRELRILNYLDLFPVWDSGISKLLNGLGLNKKYTHNFIALGDTQKSGCRLSSLSANYGVPAEQVIPVSLETIPVMKFELVPSEGLKRDGIAKNIFIGLWSTMSSYELKVYRKCDWNKLDTLLFKDIRTRKDKETLIRIVRRQWALAQELPRFNEKAWLQLYGLIQNKYY